jgi:hypothetical protein
MAGGGMWMGKGGGGGVVCRVWGGFIFLFVLLFLVFSGVEVSVGVYGSGRVGGVGKMGLA